MRGNDRKNLMNMSAPELENKIAEARENLRVLYFSKNAGKLKNPHEITSVRKDIARMLTEANGKEQRANGK